MAWLSVEVKENRRGSEMSRVCVSIRSILIAFLYFYNGV